MGKRRAAKYQRATEGEESTKREPITVAYDEIVYENAAFEEYYKVSYRLSRCYKGSLCPVRATQLDDSDLIFG